jgi:hypothetical protein
MRKYSFQCTRTVSKSSGYLLILPIWSSFRATKSGLRELVANLFQCCMWLWNFKHVASRFGRFCQVGSWFWAVCYGILLHSNIILDCLRLLSSEFVSELRRKNFSHRRTSILHANLWWDTQKLTLFLWLLSWVLAIDWLVEKGYIVWKLFRCNPLPFRTLIADLIPKSCFEHGLYLCFPCELFPPPSSFILKR